MIYDIFYISNTSINIDAWNLFSKRFPTARKIENVKSFNDVKLKSFTKFFWIVWDDLIVADDFIFDYRVPKWDESYIHVFKNGEYYDGISLFAKNLSVSEREFSNRFYVNKKEIDIQASMPKPYDIFYIDTYEEYLAAIENATTDMFWAVWKEVAVDPEFKFDFKVPKYDQHIPHVFKNGKYFDGICIFPRTVKVTQREFENRFYVEKKEIDVVASTPKSYDMFFMSYNEANADINYQKLLDRFPLAKRVHGVKGIHQAHIKAAELSNTEMFWVVDADAEIVPEFNFEFEQIPYYDRQRRINLTETVHVWTSKNPVNKLKYGYGGVKLFPKQLTLDMDTTKPDMTTSISDKFQVMKQVSNITAFNIDEFSTWRSAFRECAKLSSKSIDRNYDKETEVRLRIWCAVGKNEPFGLYSIGGALAGYRFGTANVGDMEELSKINDFDWLFSEYTEWLPSLELHLKIKDRYKKETDVE